MYTGLRLPAPFRAFSHRNYALWFFGQGISLIGTWMQTMAQQVLVIHLPKLILHILPISSKPP